MKQPPTASYAKRGLAAAVETFLANVALQDVLAFTFHLVMWLKVTVAPDSPDATMARRISGLLLTVTVASVVLVRAEIVKAGWFRSLLYRVGLFFPMVASYLELRFLLPALQPKLLDLQLLAIDEALLGVTPSVWLEQFNTMPIVEWIAFFYYSYFYLMAGMLLPSLFFDRGKRLQELMFGALLISGLGHFVYTLVPGAGPHATLAFDGPLQGGFFWEQIQLTVQTAGAHLDIFPSLHTAYPVYFAVFCWQYRHQRPFKYLWPIVAFFAAHMVLATLFLRWHWFVDVLAGLALAGFARWMSILVARWEADRDHDRQMVWEPLFSRASRR